MLGRIIFSLLMLSTPLATEAQVPPPPSLPGQAVLAEQLVRTIESKDVDGYAALLADDVVVTEDGKEIAHGKPDWIAQYGKKLAAHGVAFKISPGFSSTRRLLFIEYFNSAGSWGTDIPSHCCWSYDAVAYDVADGKVTTIQRLRGGDMRLDERGKPVK
ncbi:DUF4440 domain-containing protein [Novosphingobium sp. BL-8H]|uniref:DUF4440 domain-containing protein n=1 Tax=Novosphingobium sp. BL-8H TaxID=3127640 RepID=UPI00375743B0